MNSLNKQIWVPREVIMEMDRMGSLANIPKRTDCFKINIGMQPIILSEKTVRLPKSRKRIKQIDVRYTFQL